MSLLFEQQQDGNVGKKRGARVNLAEKCPSLGGFPKLGGPLKGLLRLYRVYIGFRVWGLGFRD